MTSEGPEVTAAGSGPGELTHLDAAGRARMVDVTGKPWTLRRALARCRVAAPPAKLAVGNGHVAQGSAAAGLPWTQVISAARLAGIQAAKQTPRLVPLCHPLSVSNVDVRIQVASGSVDIEGEAETIGPTGVEMEALTACAVAALTVLCALGPDDGDVSIEDLTLWRKSGGRSGVWVRR